MAYIHVKRVGGVNYYTLRISYREGSKVITKDLENLGNDLSKIKIENLEKKHKKEIRKSYRTIKRFLDSNYYLEKIREKKFKKDALFDRIQTEKVGAISLHYSSKFLKLDDLTKKDIYENFLIKFAVNSTSIEGNTITLKEADRLLKEDIIPKNRTLREVFDLRNTKSVFNRLLEGFQKITLKMIERTHDALLENIDNRNGYRTEDINIYGQPFKPTPGRYVRDDMRLLTEWYKKNKGNMHPVALAILFHHKFENIHPFYDGNGRTGRMIMNHMLIKKGYPPIVISKRRRSEYLKVMSGSDNGIKNDLLKIDSKSYKQLITFIISELEESYWDTFLI